MHDMAYSDSYTTTAVPGETVVVRGKLLEPCGDYTWTVYLEDGSLVEIPESGMNYVRKV